LTVTGEPFRDTAWRVEVTCDCGSVKYVVLYSLARGVTLSCGCLGRERSLAARIRHGMTGTRLYVTWKNMKARCSPTRKRAENRVYREKGITVCQAWLSFEAFRDWAHANGYRDDLEIDRIDGAKGYNPSNCRFVTEVVQARNTNLRRDNRTGFIGVGYNQRDRVFYARVRRGGQMNHIGSFPDAHSAAVAREAFLDRLGDTHAVRNRLGG
jgi:hypothetical protein